MISSFLNKTRTKMDSDFVQKKVFCTFELLRSHTKEKPFACFADDCSDTFKGSSEIRYHLWKIHGIQSTEQIFKSTKLDEVSEKKFYKL
jgi:hypothetical protein